MFVKIGLGASGGVMAEMLGVGHLLPIIRRFAVSLANAVRHSHIARYIFIINGIGEKNVFRGTKANDCKC